VSNILRWRSQSSPGKEFWNKNKEIMLLTRTIYTATLCYTIYSRYQFFPLFLSQNFISYLYFNICLKIYFTLNCTVEITSLRVLFCGFISCYLAILSVLPYVSSAGGSILSYFTIYNINSWDYVPFVYSAACSIYIVTLLQYTICS
jgi:hypothetical protein